MSAEAPERWMPVNLIKHSNGKRIRFGLAMMAKRIAVRCCELLQVYWCQKKINAFIIVGLLFYLFSTLVHQLRRTIQLPEANMYIHLLTRAVREARRPLLEGALSMGRSTIAM